MVRRTKEDAQLTRSRLLDTAELLFLAKGYSGTSLHDIAQSAGATRGAVYWHFKDKADLFNAMMARVTLPMEESARCADRDNLDDPVRYIRDTMVDAWRKVARDPQVRRVFEIATHKVEYVDETQAVRQRHLTARNECLLHLREGLRIAAQRQRLRLPMPAAAAAHGLVSLFDGLIQNWLLEPEGFDLVVVGRQALDAYLGGLGLRVASSRVARVARSPSSSGAPAPEKENTNDRAAA